MKYSIKGSLTLTDKEVVIDILNKYTLWKLDMVQYINDNNEDVISFEVWLNTAENKDNLFNELKTLIDQYGEMINWHECTHDESINQPCMIAEEYRR